MGWFPSVLILYVSGLHIFHQGSHLFPSVSLIDRGYDDIRRDIGEGVERRRGGGRDRDNRNE